MNTKQALFLLVSSFAAGNALAFSTPKHASHSNKMMFDPVMPEMVASTSNKNITPKAAAAAAAAFLTPMIAQAAIVEEADGYEYGAVDAPVGIAWAAGALAILTAAVPIVMQGGEEAFEEMRERDASSWGSGTTDSLKSKKRK